MTPLKTAARTRQVSATPSVTTERPWFAAADGFHVNERACALVSRKLQPLGSPFAAGMTGLLFNRRLLWVVLDEADRQVCDPSLFDWHRRQAALNPK